MRPLACLAAVLYIATTTLVMAASGSETSVSTDPTSPPTFLFVTGQLTTAEGAARTGTVALTLSLYQGEFDTEALWQEQQFVDLDSAGRYTVSFGSTQVDGIPQQYLVNGTGLYVGAAETGQPEHLRTVISSAAYAVKAFEADLLSGKPASDFVLVNDFSSSVESAMDAAGAVVRQPSTPLAIGGLVKFVDSSGTVGNSSINDIDGNVGIGTNSPTYRLDVAGGFRSSLDGAVNGLTVGKGGGNRTRNTAFGKNALSNNAFGEGNVAIGFEALFTNTMGENNIAIGDSSLYFNGSGRVNLAIGSTSLYANRTGSYNAAIGTDSLFQNTSGSFNTAVNYDALHLNTTGSGNTAIGFSAMYSNTVGSENTAIGFGAGSQFGDDLAVKNVSGSQNTWIGYQSGPATATQLQNAIAIGYQARNSASNQVVLGNTAITSTLLRGQVEAGNKLIVNGPATIESLTVGRGKGAIVTNTAVGFQTLAPSNALTGADNTALGYQALRILTTGESNVAVGMHALDNNNGSNNTAIGYQAIYNGNGRNNTALGYRALARNAVGSSNVAIGRSAGYYELGSNTLYIDNRDRGDNATERTNALIYGTFGDSAATQTLALNGAVNIASGLQVTGGITSTGASTLAVSSGNVGIGTSTPTEKLHVAGNVLVDGSVTALYQDVAEWVDSSTALVPGTVVIIDPDAPNRVTAASRAYDTRVAGAVSAQPGVLLGQPGDTKAKVAQSGRVRVLADAQFGPIAVGDLLVTSSTPGHVMRSQPIQFGDVMLHRPGTLVGKALEALPSGKGKILVLLTLQ